MEPQPTSHPSRATAHSPFSSVVLLALLTGITFLVMGYHPGLEDDAFYLAAIKKNLNPALFPHDSDFFRLQFQATIFDKLIALSVRLTHLPLAWVVLLWQLGAIFFVLHGVWRIARRSFSAAQAQWAAVALFAVLLTLPVSGTGINLADQYLHPRTLATAAILAAIVTVLDSRKNVRKLWLAGILLALAFSVHAIMASFGISFCAFLWWMQHRSSQLGPSQHAPSRQTSSRFESSQLGGSSMFTFVLLSLGWIFEPASDAWRQAAATRGFYFLSRWQWYEWLGVFAPVILLFAFERFLRTHPQPDGNLTVLVSTLVRYGVFQTIVGLAIMLPPSLERLRPFEPMRYLHLLYLLFFLIAGGLLGQYVLGRHVYRWLVLFLPLTFGMFYAQHQMYAATAHIELPGVTPHNPWLQAFTWISRNTPVDDLFALDPHYMQLPVEDFHGFRALAERSVLADYDKDGGMAARVPRLAPRWLEEVTAQKDWRSFDPQDFLRLKKDFGVNWIVLSRADALGPGHFFPLGKGITCFYLNLEVRVCRLY